MKRFGEYKALNNNQAGSGGCGQIFLVEKENDIERKAYMLKTIDENDVKKNDILNLQNEIDKLSKLNDIINPSPYIPPIYASDKYNYIIEKKNEDECEENKIVEEPNIMKARPYYVSDYYSKQVLYYYIKLNAGGFSETYSKLLFEKILKGIKFCHDNNICHLDIKPANIIFDKNFEIKILDFGLSDDIKYDNGKIIDYKDTRGTKQYKCPEIWEEGKYYTGVEADVFSLGVILFNLVTGMYGFLTSKVNDGYYKFIYQKKYNLYWDSVNQQIEKDNLTEEFKKLYLKMVSYNPEERTNIDIILGDPWFDEIKKLTNEERQKKENELKSELKKIYDKKITNIKYSDGDENKEEDENNVNDDKKIVLAEEIIPLGYEARSIDENDEKFSNPNLIAKNMTKDRINLNYCIFIENLIDELKFMNSLCDKINSNKEEFEEVLTIKASENALKIKVKFEDKKENNIKCIIHIELFKYGDKHVLEFLRKGGDVSDYYNNVLIIKDIIKNGKVSEENKPNKNQLKF